MAVPNNCPQCGNQLKHIPAGVSRKTGKPYGEFWPCSENCGFTYREPKEPKRANGEVILMEEIQAIHDRLDKLAEYLVKKFGDVD